MGHHAKRVFTLFETVRRKPSALAFFAHVPTVTRESIGDTDDGMRRRYGRQTGKGAHVGLALALQQFRNNWDQLRLTGTLPEGSEIKKTPCQTLCGHPGQHPGWDYESPALTAELRALMYSLTCSYVRSCFKA